MHSRQFIDAVTSAIKEGRIIRTPITPDNLRQVFDKWVAMIGSELGAVNPSHYAVLFFADIMHDGANAAMNNLPARLLYDGTRPVFLHKTEVYELASEKGYRNFWSIYDRPPEPNHRQYLLERRDSLLPLDEQKFKGAFYTPLHIVDKAYDQLAETLGENWQKNYVVWDMCCGVGNLEVKHSNYRNVFMSTLDQADVDIMCASRSCVGATIFQYDYLNDDITDFGEIDYSLTNKVPAALQRAIADAAEGKKGAKKVLILINPPYAEATNDNTTRGVAKDESGAKKSVAKTRAASRLMEGYGKASNELFAQFIARARREMPTAVLAMFSTLKYVISPTFDKFRERWLAEYMGGFVVHSRAFDGVPGEFPIGFLIWDTSKPDPIGQVFTRVLDRRGVEVGSKTFASAPAHRLLTNWVSRPRANRTQVVPLKNAITPATATKDLRGTRWADGALAYLWCNSNDLQQAPKTALFSSGFNGGHGYYVTAENMDQSGVLFAVRRLIAPTWLNDRDQFLQASKPLTAEFISDCLVWMLFHGSNLSAGADGIVWDGREWSVINHFIPFTEADVGARGRFESDFMVRHMAETAFSPEAAAVLAEGKKLFARYHNINFPRKIRDDLKLNRPDAGWYQIRNALEAFSDSELTDFSTHRAAHVALGAKLRPQVYDLGFLPR